MLDFLIIAIPFKTDFIGGDDVTMSLNIDLLDYDLPLGSGSVYRNDDGSVCHKSLYHPYEHIPSSFTGMAFKVFHNGLGKYPPHVEIKASPAKLMQGHNVFGSENIALGAVEMLTILHFSYPKLFALLDEANAEVRALDVTYSARLSSSKEAQSVLDFIRNVSAGQTRANHKKYKTTAYWGGDTSRLKQVKLYIKQDEFNAQLDTFKRLALRDDKAAKRIVNVMSDERLQKHLVGLIRWEARLKSRWFERRGISHKLRDLVKFQADNPHCLKDWWRDATKDIFASFEGLTMQYLDDDSVFEEIRQRFTTVTRSGRVSHTKANNLFNFYCALRSHGCEALKQRFSNTRYYALFADLISCGFSRAYLQNLHQPQAGKVIPLIRMVNVDFSAQRPDWYVEPVSQFLRVA